MKSKMKSVLAIVVSVILLSGCGVETDKKSGTLIDNVLTGIKYVNGNNSGFTDENGKFPYESGVVEFYLGTIKIGELSSLPVDDNVFIQDIVGVDRKNTTDTKVLKIASLVQSLDSNSSTDKIEISQDDFKKFNLTNMTIDEVSDIGTLLSSKGFTRVSDEKVKRHLKNTMSEYGISTDNTGIAKKSLAVENVKLNLGTKSSIEITFNDDIKKESLNEKIFRLSTSNGDIAQYDFVYDYNVVTLNLKNTISSFDDYSLDVKVSKLLGYGTNGKKNKDIKVNFLDYTQSGDTKDITPPSLKSEQLQSKNIISNVSEYKLSGTAKDETEISKVVLQVNGTSSDISLDSEGDFSSSISLKSGANIYKVISTDTSNNVSTLSGSIYLAGSTSAGGSHSGAIKNGELYTWGRNNYGQAGLGYTSKLSDQTNGVHPNKPIKVNTNINFVSISFMQNFSIGLDDNGDVWSWGYDKNGELGRGTEGRDICTTSANCRLDIGKVTGLSNIVALDAGLSHTLALKNDGTVWAFGTNGDGELGNDTKISEAVPVQVQFADATTKITKITAGSDFSMALDDKGQLWSWGKNNYAQMGKGAKGDDQLIPVKVSIPNDAKIKEIAAGTGHALALGVTGEVYAWGNNASSQVGFYGYQYKGTDKAWERTILVPTKILDNNATNPITAVYAGGNSSYLVRADKKVYPWGMYGETKEDGKQEYNNLDFPEDKLKAITSVKDLSAGALHVVAVQENDTVFTWRWSFEGSLGGGESTAHIWFYLYPIKPDFN